jgi:predicted nuclease of predicted toxin-antitoxin system
VRLLLDEHFSAEIARRLRDRGHDVVAATERPGLAGLADRLHFASAPAERRAIVTRDVGDFRPLLTEAMRHGVETYGLVCVPRRYRSTRATIGRIVSALKELLTTHPDDDDLMRRYGGEYWL